jgi:hypothetical protein
MLKKPHKFFERYLDNDLDNLFNFLSLKEDEIINKQFANIPLDKVEKYTKKGQGAPSQLDHYYNVFDFDNENIKNLFNGLIDATKEACEYYGIDFIKHNYMIHGWFNIDSSSKGTAGVSPIKHENHFHDHVGGTGAPIFHGYYCVNAEPSTTFYKINGTELFENVNKNNRLIVSETGHPHGRDDWYFDKQRITIAYDIQPLYGSSPTNTVPNPWKLLE